jgi:hypothetical protein
MKDTLTAVMDTITDKTTIVGVSALGMISYSNLEMALKIAVGVTTTLWTVLKIWSEIQSIRNRMANDNKDIFNDN